MPKIRVDVSYTIHDGCPITFRSPCDCTDIDGLKVYYPESVGSNVIESREFALTDANGNDVGNLEKIFGVDAIVNVKLDTVNNRAFIQNANTNAYLEDMLATKASIENGIDLTNGLIPDGFNVWIDMDDDEPLTAADVGAAPAGYGVGENILIEATDEVSIDAAFSNALAKMEPCTKALISVMDASVSARAMYGLLFKHLNNNYGLVVVYCHIYNGVNTLTKRLNAGTWGEWEWENPPMRSNVEYRTTEYIDDKAVYKRNNNGVIEYRLDGEETWNTYASQMGAAPAGFGGFGEFIPALGISTTEDEQNTLLSGLWATLRNSSAIQFRLQPVVDSTVLDHAIARMYRRSTNYGGVDVSIYGKTFLHKSWFNGVWGEWEYENPPMQLGVEYRTTERYMGKPVYAKRIYIPALPDTALLSVDYSDDENCRAIRVNGVGENTNRVFPTLNFGGPLADSFGSANVVSLTTANNKVLIACGGDRSNSPAYISVYYYKTTD